MRWKPLLPLLQGLDTLLSSVTWRERFVATCLEKHPDKDIVEFWSEDHLRGLRWQAVANFCQAVPSFNFVDFVSYFANECSMYEHQKQHHFGAMLCCSSCIWLLQLSNRTITFMASQVVF